MKFGFEEVIVKWSTIKSWLFRKFGPTHYLTSLDVANIFRDLFVGHGISCSSIINEIRDDSGRFTAKCFLSETSQFEHTVQIRLDVIIQFHTGEEFIESCVGVGREWNDAVHDVIRYFCDGVFHVIYSAVSGEPCSHCQIERWEIRGLRRRVYLGPMTTRGVPELQNPAYFDWFLKVEPKIKELDLGPGRHGLRLFHAEMPDGASVSECLLDNEPVVEMQSFLHSLEWPKTNRYYSIRVFMIIDDEHEK